MIKENVHLVGREQLCVGLHVAVAQAGVVRVRVLSVQHGCVGMHPAGLISRHIHLSLSVCLFLSLSWEALRDTFLFIYEEKEYPGKFLRVACFVFCFLCFFCVFFLDLSSVHGRLNTIGVLA